MKNTFYKKLKVAGVMVTCTLITACGGGGGGGGGGSDSTATPPPSTQPEETEAPSSLVEGMKFHFYESGTCVFSANILSSSTCYFLDNNMSYTYTQTGAKTGTLTFRNDGEDLTFLLTFADRTSGSSRVDDADLSDLNLTFELEGRPAAVTPEPPAADEAPSTPSGYAPTSLDGYYFATSNYSSINGIREIGFAGGKVTIAPANVSGTYTYTRSTTNGNEAKLTLDCTGTSHDSNGELTLTYTSASTLRLSGKINGSSFNLELNMARGSVNIEEEEEDTPSTPEVDNGDPVYGFAPSSLSSNVLELAIPTRNVSKLGFSYSDVVLAPIGATSKYKYERLGDSKAKLTITSSASTYAGSLALQFSSPTEAKVTGQIGGIDIDCQASLSPGSISSDEFTPPAGGWAPESLTGSAMRFGGLYSFTSATSGEMYHGRFTYTYEKTGDNTAVIKITAPQAMYGLRFPDKSSYTLKFTSATKFLYSGTHSTCVGHPQYGVSVQYTAEEGTYEP